MCFLSVLNNFVQLQLQKTPQKQAKCGQGPHEADFYPHRMGNVQLSKDCEASSFRLFCLKTDHNATILTIPVASISSALYSGHDQLVGHSLAVLRQAEVTHEVDETSGKVQLATKLAGCIVIGERVVIIVESLTCKVRKTTVNKSNLKLETMN